MAEQLGAPAGALIELHGSRGAPLRAWVELVEGAPEGAIALDDFALGILGLQPGDPVWPRLLLASGLEPREAEAIDRP